MFFFLLACSDDNASLPSDFLSLAPDSKIRAGFPLVVLYTNILFGITVYGLPFLADNSKYVAVLLSILFKACTKNYVVNSCLIPPLNTDIVKQ